MEGICGGNTTFDKYNHESMKLKMWKSVNNGSAVHRLKIFQD